MISELDPFFTDVDMVYRRDTPSHWYKQPLDPDFKDRRLRTGKYAGVLRYNLSTNQMRKILELRYGKELDLHGIPKMS